MVPTLLIHVLYVLYVLGLIVLGAAILDVRFCALSFSGIIHFVLPCLCLSSCMVFMLMLSCVLFFFYVGWFFLSCLCYMIHALWASYILLLETVAWHCRLPFHSYLRDVADYGSVVGRVEIGIVVVDEPIGFRSHFFWSSGCNEVSLLYEQAAFKAIRYPVILPGGGDTACPFYADREPLIDDKPVIFRYTGYVDPSARPLRRSFSQQRTHALCVSLVCSITVKEHVSCDEYQ